MTIYRKRLRSRRRPVSLVGPGASVDTSAVERLPREPTRPAEPTSTAVRFVDLAAEYRSLQGTLDAAIARVVRRGDFVLGEAVVQLEEAFADFCEVEHAVGVDSGFSALELSLRALGIGPGDEVITAANTFYATAAAVTSCGARPVLVDVDPVTATMSPALIEPAITSATRAIVPVHLYGHPVDMTPIVEVADAHALHVIEDACQAHGARYRGRRAGGLGHAGAFSFYPSKNLGAFGDGGMTVTADGDLAARLRLLRNLGARERNHHEVRGFNRRLDTLQAAVVHAKLPWLDDANDRRRRAAARYAEGLAGLPIELPITSTWAEPVFHLYVVRTDDRDALREHLDADGVESGIHYPTPIHLQPAHADLGYAPGDFPVAESLSRRILSLPMHPTLTDGDVARVTASIASFYS